MADMFLSPVLQMIVDKIASPVVEKFGNIRATVKRNSGEDLGLKLEDVASQAEALLLDFTIEDALLKSQHADKVRNILLALEVIIDEGLRLNIKDGSQLQGEWNNRETSSFVIESEVYGREEEKHDIIELLFSCEASQLGEVSCVPIVGMGGIGKTTLAQLVYNDERVAQYFDVKVWVFVSDHFDAKSIMVTVVESLTKDKCNHLNMDALHSAAWNLLRKKRYLIVLDDVWTENPSDWDKLKPLFRGGIDGSKILITTRSRKVALMMDSPTVLYNLNGLSEDACWSLFKQRAFRQGEEENHRNLLPIGQQIVRKCGGLALAAKTLGSFMRFKRQESEWLFVQDSSLWNLDECESGILTALRLSYFHLPPHLKRCFAFCSLFPRHYQIEKDKLIHLWAAEGLIQNRSGRLIEDIGSEYFNCLLWMSFFQEIKQSQNNLVIAYKLHEINYDFLQSVVGSEYATLDCHLTAPSNLTKTRHLSLVCGFMSPTIPVYLYEAKRLRTLLLFSEGNFEKIPSELFASFRYLHALDLSGSGLENVNSLIGRLSCLKFLDLSHTPIKMLPCGIEQLPLQTLNLFNCFDLVALPDLTKMRNLRHLNNIGCESLSSMMTFRIRVAMQVSKLDPFHGQYELQTLPLFVVCGPSDMEFLGKLDLQGSLRITRLENLHNGADASRAKLMKKKELQFLGLYWGGDRCSQYIIPKVEYAITGSWKRKAPESSGSSQSIEPDPCVGEDVLNNLQPHQNLKRLVIKGYPGIRFPHWSLPHLNEIDLVECRKAEHLPALGNLQFLHRLSLQAMHGIKRIGGEFYSEANERPFPALKELVLIDFPNLEEFSSPDCGDGFPILSKLLVNKCPKLTVMPQIRYLQHLELRDCSANLVHLFRYLTSLKALVIEKVDELFCFSGAFPTNNALLTSLEIKSCPRLRCLPRELGNLAALKSLAIRWCQDLYSLPKSLQDLNSLESLEIGDCHTLTSLSESGTHGFSNLRSLSIENCNNLTYLSLGFQNLTSLESLTIMYCPSIGVLPRSIEHAKALRSLTILCCPKLMYLPDGLQKLSALQSLEIRGCPGLKVLPEWIVELVSLKSLAISDCHNIRSLPQGMKRLTSLQHLSIQDCPDLVDKCAQDRGVEWPKISHVPYKHIDSPDPSRPCGSGSGSLT